MKASPHTVPRWRAQSSAERILHPSFKWNAHWSHTSLNGEPSWGLELQPGQRWRLTPSDKPPWSLNILHYVGAAITPHSVCLWFRLVSCLQSQGLITHFPYYTLTTLPPDAARLCPLLRSHSWFRQRCTEAEAQAAALSVISKTPQPEDPDWWKQVPNTTVAWYSHMISAGKRRFTISAENQKPNAAGSHATRFSTVYGFQESLSSTGASPGNAAALEAGLG